jgi:hypothetical protein
MRRSERAPSRILTKRWRFHAAISKASIARSERSDRDACRPTTKRLQTSMMNAT